MESLFNTVDEQGDNGLKSLLLSPFMFDEWSYGMISAIGKFVKNKETMPAKMVLKNKKNGKKNDI